jgi:uncharacterized protein with HEPN domain
MESESSHNKQIVKNLLAQINSSLKLISEWNVNIKAPEEYLVSPEGMRTLAATCMLLESIGEAVKKVDKLLPDYLQNVAPDIPWKQIKGMRDHIAHGYFDIDADVIYDAVVNDVDSLKTAIDALLARL